MPPGARPLAAFSFLGLGFFWNARADRLRLRHRQILGMNERRRWRRLRCCHFPIALLIDARAEIPLFRPLLDHKRRSALRARLGNRLVRRRKIAIWIAAASVENPPAASSLGSAAPHKLTLVALRAFDPQRDRPRVFALRIILAADKISVAAR